MIETFSAKTVIHTLFCIFWIGRAKKPGPGPQGAAVEVFNIGVWLMHGDSALEAEVDYLVVVGHRLIPAGYVVSGLG